MTDSASRLERESPPIGVLLLESTYMDLPGGMGRADSFDFPVIQEPVSGAQTEIIASTRFAALEDAYVGAAMRLRDSGVSMITANCGFSVAFQDAVANAVGLPTMLSSLILAPLLTRVFNGEIGVLTFSAADIDEARRVAAGWPADLKPAIADVSESSAWMAMRSRTRPELDYLRMEADLRDVTMRLCGEHNPKAILVECTAMLPFETALHKWTDLPIFGITTFVHYLVERINGVRSADEIAVAVGATRA
jgi:hypothetical protein